MRQDPDDCKGRRGRRGEGKVCSNYLSGSPKKENLTQTLHYMNENVRRIAAPSIASGYCHQLLQSSEHVTCAFIHSRSRLDLEGDLPWAESSCFLYFCINFKNPRSSGNTAMLLGGVPPM